VCTARSIAIGSDRRQRLSALLSIGVPERSSRIAAIVPWPVAAAHVIHDLCVSNEGNCNGEGTARRRLTDMVSRGDRRPMHIESGNHHRAGEPAHHAPMPSPRTNASAPSWNFSRISRRLAPVRRFGPAPRRHRPRRSSPVDRSHNEPKHRFDARQTVAAFRDLGARCPAVADLRGREPLPGVLLRRPLTLAERTLPGISYSRSRPALNPMRSARFPQRSKESSCQTTT
jgi:hypothetical protein